MFSEDIHPLDTQLSAGPARMVIGPEEDATNKERASKASSSEDPPIKIAFQANHEVALQGEGEHSTSELKRSLHGVVYQLRLLTLFLWRGMKNKWDFSLATEMEEAQKFDDLVFKVNSRKRERDSEAPKFSYRFLQAKHKQLESEKITSKELLKGDDKNFSLQKYFISYLNIKKQDRFKDGALQDFIICSNITFDLVKDAYLSQEILDEIKDNDPVLSFREHSEAKCFKFKKTLPALFKEELYTVLRNSSDSIKLAEALLDSIFHKTSLTKRSPILKRYHLALAKEVIDIKTKKIYDGFIQGHALSEEAKAFRDIFKQRLEIREGVGKKKETSLSLNALADYKLEFSKGFGKEEDSRKNTIEENDEDAVEQQNLPNSVRINDAEIDKFLELLVFAVSQPNVDMLSKIVRNEIGEYFNLDNSYFIASHFESEMLNWMKSKKGSFLTAAHGREFFEKMKQELSSLMLIGPTLEHKARLEKNRIHFTNVPNLNSFFESEEQQVLKFIASESLSISSLKIYQILVEGNYSTEDKYIFINITSCYFLIKKVVSAFKDNLLVIVCNDLLDEDDELNLFSQLNGVIEANAKSKLILIGKKESRFMNLFQRASNEIEDDSSGFSELDEQSKRELSKKIVLFQGIQCPLETVAENLKFLSSKSLMTLTDMAKIEIGEPEQELSGFDSACYIPREFRELEILEKAFKKDIEDVFVVSGIKKSQFLQLIREEERVCSIENFIPGSGNVRFLFVEDSANINSHCQKLKNVLKTKNVHRLHKKDGKFVWQETQGKITNIREFMRQTSLTNLIKNLSIPFQIISDEPGMGKSTWLIKYSNELKKLEPSFWIVKKDLIHYKETLQNKTNETLEEVIETLANMINCNNLAKEILAHKISKEGKIILLFDGLDEIDEIAQKNFIKILKILKNNSKVTKAIVTTRKNLKPMLENELGLFVYSFEPFSKDNRKTFLRKFWRESLGIKFLSEEKSRKINGYIEALLARFSDSTLDKENDFLGLPLQARMLAEVFLERFEVFYYSENNDPCIDNFDLLALYEKFIEKKYLIYIGRYKLHGLSELSLKNVLINALSKIHQYWAFCLLFPERYKEIFSDEKNLYFSERQLNAVGIAQCVQTSIYFIHRTFAEYFVSSLLVKRLNKSTNHYKYEKTVNFLLEEIFKTRNKVIISFIERIINKQNNTVLNKKWQSIRSKLLCDAQKNDYLQMKDIHKHNTITKRAEVENAQETSLTAKNIIETLAQLKGRLGTGSSVASNALRTIEKCINDSSSIKNSNEIKAILKVLFELTQYGNHPIFEEKIPEKIEPVILQYVKSMFGKVMKGTEKFEARCWKQFQRGEEYKKYDELKQLAESRADVNSVLHGKLTQGKLLYLAFNKFTFSLGHLKALEKHYSEFNHDGYYMALFFKIEEANAAWVKDFFIQKNVKPFYMRKLYSCMVGEMLSNVSENKLPPAIEPLKLIHLSVTIVEFCFKNKESLVLEVKSIRVLFSLIEDCLNKRYSLPSGMTPPESLKILIDDMLNVINVLGLALIDVGDKLKVLDYNDVEVFELRLKYKRPLVSLIGWRKNHPTAENEFQEKCKQTEERCWRSAELMETFGHFSKPNPSIKLPLKRRHSYEF